MRPAVREDLADRGFAVHAIDDHLLQICVTETGDHAVDEFVDTLEVVAR